MPLPFTLSNVTIETVPVGTILPFSGNTLPQFFLWCDGGSCASYPKLVTALGGSTVTPDLRGRTLFGAGSGTFGTIRSTGGSYNFSLSANNLPAHTHVGNTSGEGNHVHNVDGVGDFHNHGVEGVGDHQHWYSRIETGVWGGVNGDANRGRTNYSWQGTSHDGPHSHALNGDGGHGHNTNSIGNHAHTFTSATNTTNSSSVYAVPPYCTLNYIIKAVD